MEQSLAKAIQEKMTLRSYSGHEELRILEFLNLCYGDWGNLNEWKWRNVKYPTFKKDNIVIAELDGRIIGCGALFFRNLHIPGTNGLRTATLGDAAVHPKYRGKGIYSRITHETRIPIATSKGAALLFLHTQKESVTHKANRKRGFIEIHYPVYIKIINARKVLMAELRKYIMENKKLKQLQFENTSVCLSDSGVSVNIEEKSGRNYLEHWKVNVEIDEGALPLLIKMKTSGRVKVIVYFFTLFLFGKVRLRISPSVNFFAKTIKWSLKFVNYLYT